MLAPSPLTSRTPSSIYEYKVMWTLWLPLPRKLAEKNPTLPRSTVHYPFFTLPQQLTGSAIPSSLSVRPSLTSRFLLLLASTSCFSFRASLFFFFLVNGATDEVKTSRSPQAKKTATTTPSSLACRLLYIQNLLNDMTFLPITNLIRSPSLTLC
jgi:hypothetical protein